MLRLLMVLAVACVGVAAPVPKGMKAKKPELDGKWGVERFEMWEFAGDKLTISTIHPRTGRVKFTRTITLSWPDRSKPQEVDYTDGNRTLLCLVGWDSDELVFCFPKNETRPAGLSPDAEGVGKCFRAQRMGDEK